MARDIAQEAQRTAEMASQVRDLSLGYTLNQILGNKSEVQINPVWDFVFFEIFYSKKSISKVIVLMTGIIHRLSL